MLLVAELTENFNLET